MCVPADCDGECVLLCVDAACFDRANCVVSVVSRGFLAALNNCEFRRFTELGHARTHASGEEEMSNVCARVCSVRKLTGQVRR